MSDTEKELEKKCPRCGAGFDELDFYVSSDGIWCWNCFSCGASWCESLDGTTEVDEEEDEKER